MADLVIRDLDPGVLVHLHRRADANGRTVEQEAAAILRRVAELTPRERLTLADEIAAANRGPFSEDSTAIVRANRDTR